MAERSNPVRTPPSGVPDQALKDLLVDAEAAVARGLKVDDIHRTDI